MMQSVNHSTACFVCATPGSNTLAGDIFDARVGVCVRKVCRVCQCLKRWLSKYSAHSPLVVAPMCVRSLACVRVCVCVYVRLTRAIVCAVEMRTIWPGSGYGGCDEHAAVCLLASADANRYFSDAHTHTHATICGQSIIISFHLRSIHSNTLQTNIDRKTAVRTGAKAENKKK